MADAQALTLSVGAAVYAGWKRVAVRRSIETISGTFEIAVSERWPQQQAKLALGPGMACKVAIGGKTVITGYIDDVEPSYRDGEHGVVIRGRDATGDLVDCSAIHATGQWANRSLAEIAADLCKPFGIAVRTDVDLGDRFPTFAIQDGETAFECIERACRQRGVLPLSDGLGSLLFTRATSGRRASTPLVRGVNIKEAQGSYSDRERFRDYTVKGQSQGSDTAWGVAAAEPMGKARDPSISRYRPLVVIAEAPGDSGKLARRAQWEANVRAGRARRATIKTQGWHQANGDLWEPNLLVTVRDDWLAIDREMLIVDVALLLGPDGSEADISVARPEAFELIELPEKKKEAVGW